MAIYSRPLAYPQDTDLSLAVIAEHYDVERAQEVTVMNEYEWQLYADNDAFTQYIDQGNLPENLALLGRA